MPQVLGLSNVHIKPIFWSNYSDLTWPIFPKWWFSKGIPLISGKSRLVKYYNLARILVGDSDIRTVRIVTCINQSDFPFAFWKAVGCWLLEWFHRKNHLKVRVWNDFAILPTQSANNKKKEFGNLQGGRTQPKVICDGWMVIFVDGHCSL